MTALGQVRHVFGQAALQVGSFVVMPGVGLGQFVDHADHLGQKSFGFLLVRHFPQLLDRRTRRFLVVAIVNAFLGILTNSLLG